MSITTSFGFTNVTDSTVVVTPKKLGANTNYALISDEPNECITSNTTCPVDQEEIITYRSKRIPTVNTAATIQYPNPVKKGVQYTVSVEDVLRATDSVDGSVVDHPIVAYLVVRHDLSGDITDSDVATVVTRVVSAMRNDDGTWKFDKLRRSALKPTAD